MTFKNCSRTHLPKRFSPPTVPIATDRGPQFVSSTHRFLTLQDLQYSSSSVSGLEAHHGARVTNGGGDKGPPKAMALVEGAESVS